LLGFGLRPRYIYFSRISLQTMPDFRIGQAAGGPPVRPGAKDMNLRRWIVSLCTRRKAGAQIIKKLQTSRQTEVLPI
jgi:hypothetical protein